MVSVIISTYNRIGYLEKCISSILQQTYADFEIIVIDDASSCDVKMLIDKFKDNRIKYFKLEKHSGGNRSMVRNIGVSMSSGNVIALCDDDDIWHKDKLMIQMQKLNQYDFVCSNAYYIDSDDIRIDEEVIKFYKKDSVITKLDLLNRNTILLSTVIFKKEVLNYSGFLDEKIIDSVEDYEFYIRMVDFVPIYFINICLASIRIHQSFTYSGNNRERMLKSNINLLKNYINKDKKDESFAAKTGIFASKYNLFKYYLQRSKYLNAFKYLIILIFELRDFKLGKYFIKRFLKK